MAGAGNRGNLRGIPEEPIKEGVSWQAQGMVREVQISWRGGGWGGRTPPPCSKNKEFVLTLHGNRGNLRGISEEPIKESVLWQVQGMVREVQSSWRGGGLGGGFPF